MRRITIILAKKLKVYALQNPLYFSLTLDLKTRTIKDNNKTK